MKKSDFISIGILAVFCVVFWNLLDFIYTVLINGGSYSFSVFSDICLPVVIGMTVGYITALRRKNAGR
ncbi:MAG: hypothetical protein IJM51_12305 [Clostridia bacterium]|nr:hypothetical protein [Clostridia bacterium]